METVDSKQQTSTHHTRLVIVVLLIIALLSILLRVLYADHSSLPQGDTVWRISFDLQLNDTQKGDVVMISPPWNNNHVRLVSQQLQYNGMRQLRAKAESDVKRLIRLQTIKAGDLNPSVVFDVHISVDGHSIFNTKNIVLDDAQRTFFLRSEDAIDLQNPEIRSTFERLSQNTENKDELVESIFTYTNSSMINVTDSAHDDIEIALRTGKATTLGRARSFIALCRAGGIPARIVTGFIVEQTLNTEPYYWAEAYINEGWVPYDLEAGFANKLPYNYIAMNRGDTRIITSTVTDKVDFDVEITQRYDYERYNIILEKNVMDVFDLNRFPPATRANIALMLLLPIAVLVSTLFRTAVGTRAYGTYTPTLLALAAVFADWVTGLVLLSIVIALSFTGRSVMPTKLTRIPRLGLMFTLVVMSLAMGISVMDFFKSDSAEYVILLPVVILANLIDRFYSTVEDNGVTIALRRLAWTVVMTICCYPVLIFDELGIILMRYPEIHFLTLAGILSVTLYKGKTLADLSAFKWAREPEMPKRRRRKDEGSEAD